MIQTGVNANTKNVASRPKLADYLVMPGDIFRWAQSLSSRDAAGFGIMILAGGAIGLWLGDWSAGLFASGMALALWWHVNSKWSFGTALVLLALIPVMQFAYNANLIFQGANIATGLAVAVWYLLAIGVVSQVVTLARHLEKTEPSSAEPIHAADTGSQKLQRRPAPTKPAVVPSWRKRLDDIERESREDIGSQNAMDGLRRKIKP
jgi:hypothetical protein